MSDGYDQWREHQENQDFFVSSAKRVAVGEVSHTGVIRVTQDQPSAILFAPPRASTRIDPIGTLGKLGRSLGPRVELADILDELSTAHNRQLRVRAEEIVVHVEKVSLLYVWISTNHNTELVHCHLISLGRWSRDSRLNKRLSIVKKHQAASVSREVVRHCYGIKLPPARVYTSQTNLE